MCVLEYTDQLIARRPIAAIARETTPTALDDAAAIANLSPSTIFTILPGLMPSGLGVECFEYQTLTSLVTRRKYWR